LVRKQSVAGIGAALVSLLTAGAALAWLSWRTLRGSGTLGDIALYYQALMGSQSLIRGMTGSLGHVYSNSLFLGSLFEFLDLKPMVVDAANTVPAPSHIHRAVRFENVTFQYPNTERTALCNFDLTIPAGKIVAIVGPNGAGKSTLLKLVARFYDPDEGSVSIDGVNIRNIPVRELRQMVSVLFQMPVTYDASAAENIAVGDIRRVHSRDALKSAAKSAGAHEVIRRLPQGYDTPLGKAFENGNELSSGEWHRVAMARAFLRDAPLILLDEPTSFMDSWAEADWFENLRALATGRTAVVITHRFTIAMRADLIHVMRAGTVIESGTHNGLLAADGFYAESWKQQTEAVATVSAA
jgi:ATP-binding cassette subfamily B protein